jgi:arthrofactin-type cyclic lipopeptide synthetase C
VAAAAGLYLRAVEQACPEGPVHLLGHSFGGWVAFEMALRLRAAGRTVGSLTILDTDEPDGDPAGVREADGTEAFLRLVHILELSAERDFGIGADQADGLDDDARLRLLHAALVKHGLMSARSGHEVLQGPCRTFAACLRTTYVPADVYPDPLRLVLVRDPAQGEAENHERFAATAERWRRWAPALELRTADGTHVTALRAPHVASLAAHLDAGRRAGEEPRG